MAHMHHTVKGAGLAGEPKPLGGWLPSLGRKKASIARRWCGNSREISSQVLAEMNEVLNLKSSRASKCEAL